MKIRFCNDHVSVWTIGKSPVIFSKFHRADVSTTLFTQLNSCQLNLIKELALEDIGKIHSVCDASRLPIFSFELMISMERHSLPLQFKAGLAFKAFVMPENDYPLEILMEVEKEIQHLPVGIFKTSREATDYLAKHVSQKPVFN
jgi:hypothetical protein